MTQRPFDDIRALMADLPAPDPDARARLDRRAGGEAARASLGDLGDIAGWIADWRGRAVLNRPIIALYAGAHAGVDEVEVLRGLMEAVAAGQAPVCRAAGHLGAGLDVFDLAVDRPVGDPALGPAMSERECAATMAFGMEALAKQPDLLALGALGRGAAVAAAAIGRALDAPGDPLELLRALGGRETAAIAGAILAARTQKVPVLLEGFGALAAAAVLHAADPAIIAHCRVGATAGGGRRALLDRLGLTPLTDLKLTLEDGTGSTAALCLVKLACALFAED
jgi:nicotinate-nucleotide--dimethylbenzimidazole phosphoribosyltransferase